MNDRALVLLIFGLAAAIFLLGSLLLSGGIRPNP